MTPNPPSSSDGSSLPPRHRPNKGNLSKDTTEMDLWAFDDLEAPQAPVPAASKAGESVVPPPRTSEKQKSAKNKDAPAPKGPGNPELIQVNVSKARSKSKAAGSSNRTSKADSDFDDLDHWEDTAPILAVVPAIKAPEPNALEPEKSFISPMPVAVEEISSPAAPVTEPGANDGDEFSPVIRANAVSISLRPHLGLSKAERIGLSALLVLLLLGACFFMVYSLNRLPTESVRVKANDFPIEGKNIRIVSAESYWRTPVRDGKNSDTVRRGTEFMPVVKLTAGSGNAAIRVFFRDHEKEAIGDAVTRSLKEGQTLEIAATAGFEDVGMYSAYRTGESKPWTIEVYEAPSVNSANPDFKKLFEMNISTDRR